MVVENGGILVGFENLVGMGREGLKSEEEEQRREVYV